MAQWYTPPQIARDRSLRIGKVVAWIRSGELVAVNCAEQAGQRPRWRISTEALEAFDRGRSNRVMGPPPAARPRKRAGAATDVVEFF